MNISDLNRINEQYEKIREFEKDHLGLGFWEGIKKGFSSEKSNPLYKYLEYLKYDLLPFLYKEHGPFDLCSVGVVNHDISVVLYELFSVLDSAERRHPMETRDDLIRCYLSLKELHNDPYFVIDKLMISPMLTDTQMGYVRKFLYVDEQYLTPEFAGYEIQREPYFRFKRKPL